MSLARPRGCYRARLTKRFRCGGPTSCSPATNHRGPEGPALLHHIRNQSRSRRGLPRMALPDSDKSTRRRTLARMTLLCSDGGGRALSLRQPLTSAAWAGLALPLAAQSSHAGVGGRVAETVRQRPRGRRCQCSPRWLLRAGSGSVTGSPKASWKFCVFVAATVLLCGS